MNAAASPSNPTPFTGSKPDFVRRARVDIPRHAATIIHERSKQKDASVKIDLSDYTAMFRSSAMERVLHVVERIARADAAVLLSGEAGTGKELIADFIHLRSGRSNVLKINWGSSLTTTELEAVYAEIGAGTLILRDIGEMPHSTQGALLALLEKQEHLLAPGIPGGASNPRLIALTNHRPDDALNEGKLRQDLYYRVSAIPLRIPPLRERPEDIMPLANWLLKQAATEVGRSIAGFTPAAADLLTKHEWPGNGSELQNQVLRAAAQAEGPLIDASDLHIALPAKPELQESQDTSFTLLEDAERQLIVQTLKETGGNKVEAAKRIGIGRQTLYNKIKFYRIEL